MGWRDWFQPPAVSRPAARTISAIDARGEEYMAVKGESFYEREFIAQTGGGVGEWSLQLLLVRDPGNRHDANCIRVQTPEGRQLGNLSRENAERFADNLDDLGGVALVDGVIRRRQLDHNWNVVLRVDYGVLEGQ